MKGIAFLFPLLVASSAVLPQHHVKRQNFGDIGSILSALAINAPSTTAVKIEKLSPTLTGNGVKRVRLTYGPFTLKGTNSTGPAATLGNFASLDPRGTGWAYVAGDFPTDITVSTARMSLVHANGDKIGNNNGVYTHHAIIYDTSKTGHSNIACPGGKTDVPVFNYLMVEAADTVDMTMPDNYTNGNPMLGIFIKKGSKILLNGDLVNYNEDAKDIYMVLDMQYFDGKRVGLLEPTVHLVTVGSCGSKEGIADIMLHPPANKKQWSIKGEGVVKEDAKILAVRGHLHDGGVDLVMKINDKVACDSKAVYKADAVGNAAHGTMSGGMNAISDMDTCYGKIDVHRGDKLYFEANYDLDKHPVRIQPGGNLAEVMALMGIMFGKELR